VMIAAYTKSVSTEIVIPAIRKQAITIHTANLVAKIYILHVLRELSNIAYRKICKIVDFTRDQNL